VLRYTRLRLPPPGRLPVTGPVDAIDGYYKPGYGTVMRQRLKWVLRALPPRRLDSVLEIGYGSGVFQYELARRAAASVGIDIHALGAVVRERLAADGVHVTPIQGDGSRLPFADNSFDAVVIVSALEFVPDPGACLLESLRVLRLGGRLVGIVPRQLAWADRVYKLLAGFDPETEFAGGRARVHDALADVLPNARLANRPAWLPSALAPYELLSYDVLEREVRPPTPVADTARPQSPTAGSGAPLRAPTPPDRSAPRSARLSNHV
jgi:SAM-dependent methyltransferase